MPRFWRFYLKKVEHEINGCEFPFLWTQLMRDLWRAIIINLRNFILEVLATLALGVLAFVPVVGLLSPLVMLLVQSYFFGFALMDYNAERHRMNRRSTQRWMRAHFWTVVGIGLIFHFAFLIPLAGWILAPIWGTAAGTLSFLNLAKKSKSSDWILDN
ncbi:MAG: EI24 domain-containing protein [Owenweeksia sp.]|nr:EI24 domain-containing protein [Owenweeksia sp.]